MFDPITQTDTITLHYAQRCVGCGGWIAAGASATLIRGSVRNAVQHLDADGCMSHYKVHAIFSATRTIVRVVAHDAATALLLARREVDPVTRIDELITAEKARGRGYVRPERISVLIYKRQQALIRVPRPVEYLVYQGNIAVLRARGDARL